MVEEDVRDLSSYFARRTSEHVLRKLGSARYSDGSFEYDSDLSNRLMTFEGYRITFLDEGDKIKLVFDNNEGNLVKLRKSLKSRKFNIKRQDSQVLRDVSISNEGELALVVLPVHYANSSGRTQNRNELFHAVYRSAIVPALESMLEVSRSS